MISRVQIRTLSKLGHRGTLGVTLLEIAPQMENLIVLTADLSTTSGLARYESTYPSQFMNMGISEMNMIGVAAGLAMEKYVPFTTTFATFAAMRSYEVIRVNLGYMKNNVKVVGMAGGFSMGMFGNTHYAIEDIALMRAIPNLTVLCPSDCLEVSKVVKAAAAYNGPVYIRLGGIANVPIVYQEDYDFQIGKAITLCEGTDIAIIATGTMVYQAREAAKILLEKGISASVVNMHTVKPLDSETLQKVTQGKKLIVTVEEHNIIGGLGSAVAELISTYKQSPRQLFIGVPDTFCKPGTYEYLLDYFGLTAEKIADKIMRTLE